MLSRTKTHVRREKSSEKSINGQWCPLSAICRLKTHRFRHIFHCPQYSDLSDKKSLTCETVPLSVKPRTQRVVDDVSFALWPGKTLCIAGESGSGKSLTSLAIMGLLPEEAQIPGGAIIFDNQDLLSLPERQMQLLRGKSVAMIFQEPMTSLNPLMTVGQQLEETLQRHEVLGRRERRSRVSTMLDAVKMALLQKS